MKKIIGILVFTNQGVLNHKLTDGKRSMNMFCFWEMKRFPKRLREEEYDEARLYLAVGGQIKGYFEIDDIDLNDDGGRLEFFSEDWHPIENGKILKPSQGFRYYEVEE